MEAVQAPDLPDHDATGTSFLQLMMQQGLHFCSSCCITVKASNEMGLVTVTN